MASQDEWHSALSRFQLSPEHTSALAGHLSQTGVPVAHVESLSAIHVGGSGIKPGAGAIYKPQDRSIHLTDPVGVSRVSPAAEQKYRRTVAHEIGHGVTHHLQPKQFAQNMSSGDAGRGYLEAAAENYADQAVPGSFSGYDYEHTKGRMPDSYKAGRGQRYGNIDPRLR